MSKLRLTLACGDYDRTRALADGTVQVEGIDLNYIPIEPEELFWRMARHGEFDAAEFSLSAYLILTDQGDDRFIAIPIFPSRFFRHSSVFINTNSGVSRAEDLRGKRIGIPDYTMTAGVWLRGIFQHQHGVSPTDCYWFTGGLDEPGRKQRVPTPPIPGLEIKDIGPEETLGSMLERGEIDCLIGAREPRCFREGRPYIRRLWPNYKDVEKDYFRKTGIFPIMHTIVIKKQIYERNPWVAQSLFKGFCRAKDVCQAAMSSHAALKHMLPWLMDNLEEVVGVLGKDFWPYGLERNRKVVDTLASYAHEQGLTQQRLTADSLFARETLDTSKI